MGLQELWFILLAVLFCGFFVLEGFDFGVGMLMHVFGRTAKGDPEKHRRAVLEHHRPGLGRQRGVVDHRGRRDVRGLSRHVRDGVLRALPTAAGSSWSR